MTKKKKEQRILIVSIVLLVLVCVSYLVVTMVNDKKEKEADQSVSLLQVKPSTVERLHIKNSTDDFEFVKKSSLWELESDKNFKVDQDVVDKILDTFKDLVAKQTVVKDKKTLSEYGLDQPAVVATLTMNDGKKEVLSLGTSVADMMGYYGMLDSKDGVYIFAEDTLEVLFSDKEGFNLKDSTTPSPEQ